MLNKLVRLSRDAEITTSKNGKQFMRVSAVYNVGFGDNQRPVWLSLTMFGDRIQSLHKYLLKGAQVVVSVDDVEPDAYQKQDGTTALSLKGVIQKIEFASKAENKEAKQEHQAPVIGGNFDDDIPF